MHNFSAGDSFLNLMLLEAKLMLLEAAE